jgi:hypothetical protein
MMRKFEVHITIPVYWEETEEGEDLTGYTEQDARDAAVRMLEEEKDTLISPFNTYLTVLDYGVVEA